MLLSGEHLQSHTAHNIDDRRWTSWRASLSRRSSDSWASSLPTPGAWSMRRRDVRWVRIEGSIMCVLLYYSGDSSSLLMYMRAPLFCWSLPQQAVAAEIRAERKWNASRCTALPDASATSSSGRGKDLDSFQRPRTRIGRESIFRSIPFEAKHHLTLTSGTADDAVLGRYTRHAFRSSQLNTKRSAPVLNRGWGPSHIGKRAGWGSQGATHESDLHADPRDIGDSGNADAPDESGSILDSGDDWVSLRSARSPLVHVSPGSQRSAASSSTLDEATLRSHARPSVGGGSFWQFSPLLHVPPGDAAPHSRPAPAIRAAAPTSEVNVGMSFDFGSETRPLRLAAQDDAVPVRPPAALQLSGFDAEPRLDSGTPSAGCPFFEPRWHYTRRDRDGNTVSVRAQTASLAPVLSTAGCRVHPSRLNTMRHCVLDIQYAGVKAQLAVFCRRQAATDV
ncbi:uncharacterized protein B0H18DRAFT_1126480 [Fomitopsis serialis]|uniref:uncharacterized protein n=1 Tax=Fomitopsis serialis TaxID=139415 RepID=UPI0020084F30|nr:uncharacterized protein B0H18DRAFT_1126480 [Neoantrodia serialis]KAH9913238.1 hypothetical protein B0H18DRAFT_1126480 [Neoantrodia serialis]